MLDIFHRRAELLPKLAPLSTLSAQATNTGLVADVGRGPRRKRWLGRPTALYRQNVAGKIAIPYLALVFLVPFVATTATLNFLAGSLDEKFREELGAAARSANEAVVKLEAAQLAVVRQMAFTIGVDGALATADTDALETLLAPIAANAGVAYVDAFGADGTQLLALRSPHLGPDAEERVDPAAHEWTPVNQVLRGSFDHLGDRYSNVVVAPWGPGLVTAAPVKRDGEFVGVVAITLPIEEITLRLSQESGSKGITLYDQLGRVVASTISPLPAAQLEALNLPRERLGSIQGGDQLPLRRTAIGETPYVEGLTTLVVRQQPVLLMGVGTAVTIIEEQAAAIRSLMIGLFAAVVALVVGVGLVLARRIVGPARERERARAAIESYMSPKVYRLIQTEELTMGGTTRELTVVNTDIRGFSSLSETMDGEALIRLLNRYFERVVTPIAKYEGEVDKYLGDGILAKFGATEWYPDHAARAVLAMMEMIEACGRFSDELVAEGARPIRMGIGANTGRAVVGNLGSTARMEYTIISDAVNTAQRVQELCKVVGWDLLITASTYEQANAFISVGQPWSARLRGQARATVVYPVLWRKGYVPPERAQAYELLQARLKDRGVLEAAYLRGVS